MLSILVPIYRFDAGALIRELHEQATSSGIPFEVLCMDDGSGPGFEHNATVCNDLPHAHYLALPENIGRSAIRNRLAQEAGYDHVLLLDCDAALPDGRFIERYVPFLNKDMVVYGGRSYQASPPDNKQLMLHWLYGSNREAIPAEGRSGYQQFMTNNILVPRQVVLNHPLSETLKGYGHEDTLWGLELEAAGIPIEHINNPLVHIGLETAASFLQKTREGVQNLLRLDAMGVDDRHIQLLATYRKLKRWRLRGLIRQVMRIKMPWLEKNLLSSNPSLFYFDLYKLGCMLGAVR
ncbi:MAG: glycosyltransferase family 2 protein [Flavobacteriales bacterium]|nr:glycosyltransferase family 2 protein [Flavobacteriales bacterium]MCB9447427.1 glycosyltransferase family 2 protein [Flavobacteriales bacterium]